MAKSKKTVKKASTKKPVTEFHLMVAYPGKLYFDEPTLDRRIEDAVGKRADGSGMSWWATERDLSFSFYTQDEASAAAKRAKKVNRKITTSVTVWGD